MSGMNTISRANQFTDLSPMSWPRETLYEIFRKKMNRMLIGMITRMAHGAVVNVSVLYPCDIEPLMNRRIVIYLPSPFFSGTNTRIQRMNI
jgi:hypothetical protein